MPKILTIDFDIIMYPCIKLYNKKKEVGRRAGNADMFCDEWELECFSKTAE